MLEYSSVGDDMKKNDLNENIILLKKLAELKQIISNSENSNQYQLEYHNTLNMLIENNSTLVISIAKSYCNRGVDFDDLFQEGILGLIKAIERFEIDKGYSFSTYATFWIKQTILSTIIENKYIIKTTPTLYYLKIKMNWVINKYIMLYNRKPSLEELSQELNVSVKTLKKNLNFYNKYVYLDSDTNGYMDKDTPQRLENFLNSNLDVEQNYFSKELKDNVNTLLEQLSSREESMIRMHFGIPKDNNPLFYEPHSLAEVGNEFHLTRERARQIVRNAINKISRFQNITLLDNYHDNKEMSFWNLLSCHDENKKLMKFNTLSVKKQNFLYCCFGSRLDKATEFYNNNVLKVNAIIEKLNNTKIIPKEHFLWEKLKCPKNIFDILIKQKCIIENKIPCLKEFYGEQLDQAYNDLLLPLGYKEKYEYEIKYLKYYIEVIDKIMILERNLIIGNDLNNLYLEFIKLIPKKYQIALGQQLDSSGNFNVTTHDPLLEEGLKYFQNIINIYNSLHYNGIKLVREKN